MCMFILWLSIVTLHMNPLPQSLQWNLLSESAMCTPCIWCFTVFTRSRAVDLPLVQLQVSIFEHFSTIRTRHHH